MSRLSELYKKTITTDLMSKLNIENVHEVPKINKIILNMGIGEAKDDAKIVDKAVEFKLGARGLRSICETILIDDMFNLPGSKIKKLLVDKNYIASKLDNVNFSNLKEAS